jgi:type I restriction enzyme S subunit
MIDRTHKALQNVDVSKIANAYHSWRSNQGLYDDIPGFCKSATLDEVRERRYLLTPGVYVGTETETDLADSIDERIDVLKTRYIFEQSRAADTTNRLTRTLETLGIPSLGESVSGALFDTASRLFQSWFVDFDPVRESHREQIAFLPNNLRKAFPITMIQSEAGQIPAGWHFFGLDDIATFLNGLALQKFPPVEGEPTLPVIKITQLRASDTLGADRCAASLKPDYIINNGDILFSWSGSLECEIWTGGAGALNQHLFKVYSATYPRWFVYLAILQHLGNFRRIAADKATTMGHIQRHHLHDAKIAVPSNDLLQKAGAILEPLVEIAWQKKVADKTLVSLWNSVMPKILAGNLAVSELPELFGQSA